MHSFHPPKQFVLKNLLHHERLVYVRIRLWDDLRECERYRGMLYTTLRDSTFL